MIYYMVTIVQFFPWTVQVFGQNLKYPVFCPGLVPCPGMSRCFFEKKENFQDFGKTHLVTLES